MYNFLLAIKDEVKRRLGVKFDLYQSLIERKLTFFGHVCTVQNEQQQDLMKAVVFGVTGGPNKPGRPRRDWYCVQEWYNMYNMYNIQEWYNMYT